MIFWPGGRRVADRGLTGGLPEFGTGTAGSFPELCSTRRPSRCSTTWVRGKGGSGTRLNGSPHLPANHPPVLRRLAWPLGGQYARNRLHDFIRRPIFRARAEKWHLSSAGRGRPNLTRGRRHNRLSDLCGRAVTVHQEFTKQRRPGKQNVLNDPRCVEGNYSLPSRCCERAWGRPRFCGGTRS